jgi:hypothetical protein
MNKFQCSQCGSVLPDQFDYRSGRRLAEQSARALCVDCFRSEVDALCERIEQASPETLDAVFLTGMGALGAGADALNWTEAADAAEDENQFYDYGDGAAGEIRW